MNDVILFTLIIIFVGASALLMNLIATIISKKSKKTKTNTFDERQLRVRASAAQKALLNVFILSAVFILLDTCGIKWLSASVQLMMVFGLGFTVFMVTSILNNAVDRDRRSDRKTNFILGIIIAITGGVAISLDTFIFETTKAVKDRDLVL